MLESADAELRKAVGLVEAVRELMGRACRGHLDLEAPADAACFEADHGCRFEASAAAGTEAAAADTVAAALQVDKSQSQAAAAGKGLPVAAVVASVVADPPLGAQSHGGSVTAGAASCPFQVLLAAAAAAAAGGRAAHSSLGLWQPRKRLRRG